MRVLKGLRECEWEKVKRERAIKELNENERERAKRERARDKRERARKS